MKTLMEWVISFTVLLGIIIGITVVYVGCAWMIGHKPVLIGILFVLLIIGAGVMLVHEHLYE